MKKYDYDFVISIGQSCFTATVLKRLNLRFFSGPLDWLAIHNYKVVINVLKSRFQDFFNKEDLEYTTVDATTNTDVYKNNRTKIIHVHDFPRNSRDNFDYHYNEVLEKYNRRLERFFKKIKNAKVCLLYIEREIWAKNNEKITNKIISNNIKELNEIYKNKNATFDIFYIKHDDKLPINKFKINNRICTLNNNPNNNPLGNIDLVCEIISNRIKISSVNASKVYLFKLKRLIKIYKIIN